MAEQELILVLDGEAEEIILTLDNGGTSYPSYEGDYDVIPRLMDQTLETAGMVMLADVTVRTIPVVYTTNPYNGQTVVIG